MERPIRASVGERADAECIRAELTQFRTEMHERGAGWIVDIYAAGDSDRAVADVLAALQKCVDDNKIFEVRVEIHDREYTMRGFTLLAATAEHA